jgi:outer membrane protein
MRKALLFTLVFAVLMGMSIPVMAFEVGVRGYYWFPGLSGDIRVDGNGVTGTTLDLETDLGMEDQSYPVIEIFGGLGNHHFSFSYYSADYEGSNPDADFDFNGLPFTGLINSRLEYDVYDFMYQYDLLDMENILAGFSLGLVGKVKLFDGNVSIQSSTLSTNHDFSVPIPMLGLNLHMGILADILEARLLVTGIGYSDGTIFDSQADISFTPFPFLDISGGYRLFAIDIDTDDLQADYNTSGPYVALTISF